MTMYASRSLRQVGSREHIMAVSAAKHWTQLSRPASSFVNCLFFALCEWPGSAGVPLPLPFLLLRRILSCSKSLRSTYCPFAIFSTRLAGIMGRLSAREKGSVAGFLALPPLIVGCVLTSTGAAPASVLEGVPPGARLGTACVSSPSTSLPGGCVGRLRHSGAGRTDSPWVSVPLSSVGTTNRNGGIQTSKYLCGLHHYVVAVGGLFIAVTVGTTNRDRRIQ